MGRWSTNEKVQVDYNIIIISVEFLALYPPVFDHFRNKEGGKARGIPLIRESRESVDIVELYPPPPVFDTFGPLAPQAENFKGFSQF